MSTEPEYQTVYVVTMYMDEDPAVFVHARDANAFADAVTENGGNSSIYELLVCDGELAAKMISEAEHNE